MSENRKNVTVDSAVSVPALASSPVPHRYRCRHRPPPAPHGWEVVATARRVERLEALAAETGCTWWPPTSREPATSSAWPVRCWPAGCRRRRQQCRWRSRPVAGSPGVGHSCMSAMRLRPCASQAWASGAGRGPVFSPPRRPTATYPGGGGYVAPHAERIANTLRPELVGETVRH